MKPLYAIFTVICILQLNADYTRAFSPLDKNPNLQVRQTPSVAGSEKGRKTVTKSKTSDDIVQSSNLTLKLALLADHRLFPYEIDCLVQEDTVELTGVVSLEAEKAAAALLTNNLMKGKKIVNHLEVQPSLQSKIQANTDSRLTELVKQRFAKSQTLRTAILRCSQFGGSSL